MTVRARWKYDEPPGATYSTPSARPLESVDTRTTRQPVRSSKLPVANASGIEDSPGCHLSSVNEPKPLLHEVYVVAGRPPYGTLFTPTGTGCGCSPIAAVACLKASPSRNGRSAGIGRGSLRVTNGFASSPGTPTRCSTRG